MTEENDLKEIEDALRTRRLDVKRVADTFNVSQGTGIMAHKANIDPRTILDELDDDAEARRRQIAGFASGVKHVLLEPSRSSADEWDFITSAGRLAPAMQVSTFALGVHAASGESPWTIDFVDDLEVAYIIKLDRGLRVLTKAQVEHWGVSDDRITAGARSLLFHKTRDLGFKSLESFTAVRRLHAGDGHDAARCFVVADAFYSDIGPDFRFTIPSPDHFLCVFESTDDSLDELHRATEAVYSEAAYPLSRTLFRFESSKPVAVRGASND